jgi:hypothetical protein
MEVSAGSTVIGNTVDSNFIGLVVDCPSNVTDNTATGNDLHNLVLNGKGCKSLERLGLSRLTADLAGTLTHTLLGGAGG